MAESNSIYAKDQSTLKKLLRLIDMNNFAAFRELFSSAKITEETVNDIFTMCWASYKAGNSFIVPFISFLLTQGADPDMNLYAKSLSKPQPNAVMKPLTIAFEHNDYYLSKQLIEAMCLRNKSHSVPQSLWDYFLEPSKNNLPTYDILHLMLSKGLMLTAIEISQMITGNKAQLIDYLIKNNIIQINAFIDKDQNTLLHLALSLYQGNSDIIDLLLHHKPDMTIKNIKGQICLDIAFHMDNIPTEVTSSLIKLYDSQLSLMNIKAENKNQLINKSNKKMAEKSKFNRDGQGDLSDYAFKFPFEPSYNKIDLPFSMQNTLDNNQWDSKVSQHSYIKIKEQPTLYLDSTADYSAEDKMSLSAQVESFKVSNQQQEALIKALESKIVKTKTSNELINAEIKALKEELSARDAKIAKMNSGIKETEELHKKKIKDFNVAYDEKTKQYAYLKEQYNQLESDLTKTTSLIGSKKAFAYENVIESFGQMNIDYMNSVNFFKRKYLSEGYSDLYIQKCLQLDLLDFQEHIKEQIKLVKPKLEELINLIQTSVNNSIGLEYEVKLYGSHATNLCLPWSDLDVVIIRQNNTSVSSYVPLHELFKHMQDNNYFHSINYIGTTNIPLIKIRTNSNFNNMLVDISLQDSKHYGIQCVALVNDLIKQYDVLVPMVLALKNILKQANLNDPYKGGLSSYGLILLILYFLKDQERNNKSVKIAEYNLGRLFFEFLYFYGMEFDPTKYIICTHGNYDQMNFFDQPYFPQQSELIIIDPLNPKNNVGKNTRQFNNIKLAFLFGFIASKEDCECGCHFQYQASSSVMSIEHCILKRIFNGVKRLDSSNVI